MGNSFFLVQANAVVGEDAELNRWYDEQHFDDCLACDTAVAAQRYCKMPGTGPGGYAYLAIYEVGDAQAFADNRRSKEGSLLLPRTAALALPAHAFFYRPLQGQPGLLSRQERSSLYIEFLDVGLAQDAVGLLENRQEELETEAGLGTTQIMIVDDYQERKGWHADAIIFAEMLDDAGDSWRPPSYAPIGSALKVAEAGLYRSMSPRRTRAGTALSEENAKGKA